MFRKQQFAFMVLTSLENSRQTGNRRNEQQIVIEFALMLQRVITIFQLSKRCW